MRKTLFRSKCNYIGILLITLSMHMMQAQQVADTTYQPDISNPAYAPGQGTVIFIDEGHHNFHTKNGRYKAFSNLLERDGYVVNAYSGTFAKDRLEQGGILVISNALNAQNVADWFLPTPSAFTAKEIDSVEEWVSQGGSLFLIADHMPMGGAAEDLANVFGFEFTNGFVFDSLMRQTILFTLEEGSLAKNVITNGRNRKEHVSRITTFTGQAFSIPNAATPILILEDRYENMLPDTAWRFNAQTPIHNAGGMSQGAFRKYGKGRVVAFGEAAMFTAQLAGPQKMKMGMNNPVAPENYQLLLNIIHWLDGMLLE